jgi:hypothetical protein
MFKLSHSNVQLKFFERVTMTNVLSLVLVRMYFQLSVKKNFVVADRHLSVSPAHLTSVFTHKSAHEVTIINNTAFPFLYAKESN